MPAQGAGAAWQQHRCTRAARPLATLGQASQQQLARGVLLLKHPLSEHSRVRPRTCQHHLARHVVLAVEVCKRLRVQRRHGVCGADERPAQPPRPCHLVQALRWGMGLMELWLWHAPVR